MVTENNYFVDIEAALKINKHLGIDNEKLIKNKSKGSKKGFK